MSINKLDRAQLIAAIDAIPDARAVTQAYFVENDDGEPTGGLEFCREHASALAWWYTLEDGKETWFLSTTMGSDAARRCAFGGCNKPLTCGHLTDCGIDDALALTETKPLKAHVYPAELSLAADSMSHDDQRWPMWEKQARRMLRTTTPRLGDGDGEGGV